MNKKLIGSMLMALALVGCATKTEVKKEVVKETPATSQKETPVSSSSTTPSSSVVEEDKPVLTDIDKKTRLLTSKSESYLYDEEVEKEFLDPKSEQALATAERYHALVQAIGANYFAYDETHYRSLAAQNTPPEFVGEEARELYETDLLNLFPNLSNSPKIERWYYGLETIHQLTQEGYVINPEKTVVKVFDAGEVTERVGVVMEKRVGDTISDSVGFVFRVESKDGLARFVAVVTEG